MLKLDRWLVSGVLLVWSALKWHSGKKTEMHSGCGRLVTGDPDAGTDGR